MHMLLLDRCGWLLHWSYVCKYFDSEILLVLHKNQEGLLLSPVYKHLKGIFG